jgi:hypothetical protein
MSHQNYLARYVEFLKKKAKAKGYGFHEVWPPPQPDGDIATASQKLPWWSFRRPKQLKKIREERDRRQQEILQKRDGSPPQK